MTLDQLKEIRANGTFHHATFRRDIGLHNGLWIYVNAKDGFRGFEPAGCFFDGDPNQGAAEDLVRGTGISVGAYGCG